jgi:hypothetical protein
MSRHKIQADFDPWPSRVKHQVNLVAAEQDLLLSKMGHCDPFQQGTTKFQNVKVKS